MKKHLPFILALTTLLFYGASVAYAQNYTPLAPLPGTTITENGQTTTNISTYVAGAIKLLIALGAALAVLYAIIGGTQYVAASINPVAKAGALERLQNALIGLAIILSSYLILNSINPDLVNFRLALEPVAVQHEVNLSTTSPTPDSSSCPTITNLADIFEGNPEAYALENGATLIFSANTESADVQQNLTRLRDATRALQLALPQLNSNIQARPTLAYVPYVYQKHLWEIYNAWVIQDLRYNTKAECSVIRKIVQDAYNKHHISGYVPNPKTQFSPHTNGTGVDIEITGINYDNFSAYGYRDINDFMTHNGIYLSWQGSSSDRSLFVLRNRP